MKSKYDNCMEHINSFYQQTMQTLTPIEAEAIQKGTSITRRFKKEPYKAILNISKGQVFVKFSIKQEEPGYLVMNKTLSALFFNPNHILINVNQSASKEQNGLIIDETSKVYLKITEGNTMRCRRVHTESSNVHPTVSDELDEPMKDQLITKFSKECLSLICEANYYKKPFKSKELESIQQEITECIAPESVPDPRHNFSIASSSPDYYRAVADREEKEAKDPFLVNVNTISNVHQIIKTQRIHPNPQVPEAKKSSMAKLFSTLSLNKASIDPNNTKYQSGNTSVMVYNGQDPIFVVAEITDKKKDYIMARKIRFVFEEDAIIVKDTIRYHSTKSKDLPVFDEYHSYLRIIGNTVRCKHYHLKDIEWEVAPWESLEEAKMDCITQAERVLGLIQPTYKKPVPVTFNKEERDKCKLPPDFDQDANYEFVQSDENTQSHDDHVSDRDHVQLPFALVPYYLSSAESERYLNTSKRSYTLSLLTEKALKPGYIYVKGIVDHFDGETYIHYEILRPNGDRVSVSTSIIIPEMHTLEDFLAHKDELIELARSTEDIPSDTYRYHEGIALLPDTEWTESREQKVRELKDDQFRRVQVPPGKIGLITFNGKPEFIGEGEHILLASESSLKDEGIQFQSIDQEHIVHGNRHIVQITQDKSYCIYYQRTGTLKLLSPGVHMLDLPQEAILKSIVNPHISRVKIEFTEEEIKRGHINAQNKTLEIARVNEGKYGIKEFYGQFGISNPGVEVFTSGSTFHGQLSSKLVTVEFYIKNARTRDNKLINVQGIINYQILEPFLAVKALAYNNWDKTAPNYDLDKIEKRIKKKVIRELIQYLKTKCTDENLSIGPEFLQRVNQKFPVVTDTVFFKGELKKYVDVQNITITSTPGSTESLNKKIAKDTIVRICYQQNENKEAAGRANEAMLIEHGKAMKKIYDQTQFLKFKADYELQELDKQSQTQIDEDLADDPDKEFLEEMLNELAPVSTNRAALFQRAAKKPEAVGFSQDLRR